MQENFISASAVIAISLQLLLDINLVVLAVPNQYLIQSLQLDVNECKAESIRETGSVWVEFERKNYRQI